MAINLSVLAHIIDCYRWVGYGDAQLLHFTFVPDTITMNTPWP